MKLGTPSGAGPNPATLRVGLAFVGTPLGLRGGGWFAAPFRRWALVPPLSPSLAPPPWAPAPPLPAGPPGPTSPPPPPPPPAPPPSPPGAGTGGGFGLGTGEG